MQMQMQMQMRANLSMNKKNTTIGRNATNTNVTWCKSVKFDPIANVCCCFHFWKVTGTSSDIMGLSCWLCNYPSQIITLIRFSIYLYVSCRERGTKLKSKR